LRIFLDILIFFSLITVVRIKTQVMYRPHVGSYLQSLNAITITEQTGWL